jgi:hypothetical protein
MVLADDAPQVETSPRVAGDIAQALLHFLGGVQAVRSVRKIAYSDDGGRLDIWILMAEEILEDAERIFRLDRAMRQRAGLLPITIHVIPLDHVRAETLPPAETFFER